MSVKVDGGTEVFGVAHNDAWAIDVLRGPVVGDRQWFEWRIYVGGRRLASGEDLSAPVSGSDARRATGVLLSFLTNDAERYQRYMGPVPEGQDDYTSGETVAEWAYGVSEELEAAAWDVGQEVMAAEVMAHAAKEGITLARSQFKWIDGGLTLDGMDPREWLEAVATDTEDED